MSEKRERHIDFYFVSISILILVLVCRRGLPSSPDQQLSIARSAKRVIFQAAKNKRPRKSPFLPIPLPYRSGRAKNRAENHKTDAQDGGRGLSPTG